MSGLINGLLDTFLFNGQASMTQYSKGVPQRKVTAENMTPQKNPKAPIPHQMSAAPFPELDEDIINSFDEPTIVPLDE